MTSLQKDPEGFEKKILHKYADFTRARVLEIGCGEGRLTWKYASSTKFTAAFDSDHDALRVARIDMPANSRGKVHLLSASATRAIPFANESFDLAVLAWSL